MAAQKTLQINANGQKVEVAAVESSAGAGDEGKIVALNTSGYIDTTMLDPATLAETKVVPASEDLAAGDLVDIWNDTGTLKVRKADASAANAGKKADGFVKAAVTAPADATVYFDGEISGLTGLTPGAEYFLSDSTPGGVTATPVTTAGNLLQSVGVAKSATTLSFEPGEGVIRG
jgi:hypothetical protein